LMKEKKTTGLNHLMTRSCLFCFIFEFGTIPTLYDHTPTTYFLSNGDGTTGGYGCPSGNLDRCLNLCAHNPSVPQNDASTQAAYVVEPKLFNDCVVTCRTFCSW
jgi:hypothetical protein